MSDMLYTVDKVIGTTNKPIVDVDFNERLDTGLVMLSQGDSTNDYRDNPVSLHEGLEIIGYQEDEDMDGAMVREGYDFWTSQPVAVPFYNNEMIAVTYDFDPNEDPGFLAEADRAVTAFLKLDDAFRLPFSKQVAEFAVINLEGWDYSGYEAEDEYEWVGLRDMSIDEEWLNGFVAGAKTPEDVWRMVGSPVDVYAARASDDRAVYVAIRWNCLWDMEH